jgi:aminoglycoside N3'-acetyltransferase
MLTEMIYGLMIGKNKSKSSENTDMTVLDIAKYTKYNPLILHLNPIGLIRIAVDNDKRFDLFNTFLNAIKNGGGNIAIPSYSYSYTKKEIYNIKTTPTTIGVVSEFLRKRNTNKRTIDPNFSYLLFGNNFNKAFFKVGDCSTFGENSLISDVFIKDGYLGAVGGALEYLTEIHYLERKLGVDYRYDKVFSGITVDSFGKKHATSSIFYCRDMESDYEVSFINLKNDLKNSDLIEEWFVSKYNFKLEVIRFKKLYEFIGDILPFNKKYLWA